MSFALSVDDGAVEWSSYRLFAQRKNLLSPAFFSMVFDVLRFGKQAPKVLEPSVVDAYNQMTLAEYLKKERYSDSFISWYLLPMCAAVWSVPNEQVLTFPITMLVRFWVNHHLLDITQRPRWRVVKDRSQQYVKKVVEELPDVRTGCGVFSVKRSSELGGPVTVTLESGVVLQYDAVVLATHSDVSLALLGESATPEDRSVLGAIPYNENDVYLHTDASLMPKDRTVWASWNFLGSSTPAAATAPVCVSYWVNKLQRLPADAPDLFVTLNPLHPPAADKVFRRLKLSHPVFSFSTPAAQQQLAKLQGQGGVHFAGAWCGYGFHEDGLRAAVGVAEALGAPRPWQLVSPSPKVGLLDALVMRLFRAFLGRAIKRGYMRFILPSGEEWEFGSRDNVATQYPASELWRGQPQVLSCTLRIHSTQFFWRILMRHDTGMGEGYMYGDYEVDDLGAYLALLVANAPHFQQSRGLLGPLNWLGDRLLHLAHLARPNTIEGSRKNIEEHYDAGNAMYKLFLDQSMTYSAAIHHPGESLYQAQMNKLDAIIQQADITAADHVLEIGCGWGSFAIRAASTTGCRVTGVTVSKQQLEEALVRVKAAGLSDKVTLIFCDYRDLPGTGTYDKVVSIEMIEAVGEAHLKTYFATIGRALKPGGRAVVQAISLPDDRYEVYCKCSDFIREHIFPGGHLLSMGAMVEAARGTGLQVAGVRDIATDYAVTLRCWREAWEQRRADILQLGYNEVFWRKFQFYFVYCEAAFDVTYIHNFQVTWVKDARLAHHASLSDAAAASVAAAGHALQAGLANVGGRVMHELPADPVLLALLIIYFFLTGMMVALRPLMVLLPFTSLVCALAGHLTHHLSVMMVPGYHRMTHHKQTLWRTNCVNLIFSTAASLVALLFVTHHPEAALQLPTILTPAGQCASLPLASVTATAAAGFFAYQLWSLVRNRLFTGHLGFESLIEYTSLLVMYGVAASKEVALPALTVLLLGEACSAVMALDNLQALADVPPSSPRRQLLLALHPAALLLLRCLPQLALALALALAPLASFPPPPALYYTLTCTSTLAATTITVIKTAAAFMPSSKKTGAATAPAPTAST